MHNVVTNFTQLVGFSGHDPDSDLPTPLTMAHECIPRLKRKRTKLRGSRRNKRNSICPCTRSRGKSSKLKLNDARKHRHNQLLATKKLLPYQKHARQLKFIDATVLLGKNVGKTKTISVMADSGADTSAMNTAYARKHFKKYIQKCNAQIDGVGRIQCTECVHLYFCSPDDPSVILSEEIFYLIPKLAHNVIAAGGLVEDLGHTLFVASTSKVKFVHKPEPDESFGTCNNWDSDTIRVKINKSQYNLQQDKQRAKELDQLTPYDQYLYLCSNAAPIGTLHRTINCITVNNKTYEFEPKHIYHVSNFKASDTELDNVKKLTMDRKLNKVRLDYLIKSRSKWLHDQMRNICDHEFKDVFAKTQFEIKTIPNKEFKVELKPSSEGQTIFRGQYDLNDVKRQVYLQHTLKNIENGLYEKIKYSPHNVPVIIVPKKDGRLRLAYDLTLLNEHTKDVKSHIPTYNWLFELMRGVGLTTVSDIKNFFENIKLRTSDRDLCAITTPLGRYRLTHASYGFKNISTVAQEISNELMAPLGRAGAFIDDVFMKHDPNATDKDLVHGARKFLQRCREMGVLLHPEKTFFFVDEVEFLGYIFTQDGTRPTRSYIDKILKVPKPSKPGLKKKILSYVGLLQYIAKYIDHMSEYTYWLTQLTRDENKHMEWGDNQEKAWNELQKRVKNIKLLAHPHDEGEFLVQCDASENAIGAVLYQRQYDKQLGRKQWKIIEFYSKQLEKRLSKYHIAIKESLALAYTLNHWRHFLLRKKFYVDCDNRAVVALYQKADDKSAPNMRKQQVFNTLRMATAQFHFELKHLAGKDNILADFLSREGSVVNDVTEPSHAYDGDVQLIGRDPDCTIPRESVIHAMSLLERDRNELFEQSKLNTVDGTINAMSDIDNLSQKYDLPTDMLHFDIEYLKEYGYIASSTSQSNVNFKNDVVTQVYEYCSDEPPATVNFEKFPNKNMKPKHSILTNPDCPSCINTNSTENMLSLAKKVSRRLVTAFLNTINNASLPKTTKFDTPIKQAFATLSLPNRFLFSSKYTHNNGTENDPSLSHVIDKKITSKTINYFKNLFFAYVCNDRNLLNTSDTLQFGFKHANNQLNNSDYNIFANNNNKTKRQKSNKSKHPTNNKAPNYRQNDEFKRRGTRIRRKARKFWELPIFGDDVSNFDKKGDNIESEIITHDNDLEPDNMPRVGKHIISFPYNIGLKLAQNLYAKLFQPKTYSDIISENNLVRVQSSDEICKHIKLYLEFNKNDSLGYLKCEYPKIANLLTKDAFFYKNKVLHVKADKYHRNDRIYIPNGLIHSILYAEHCINNIKHPGITQMIRNLSEKYFWLYMSQDITDYVHQCTQCQHGKGSKHYKVGLLSPVDSNYPGELVHFDFAGPFFKRLHIMIMVDNYSGAVVLHPCYSPSSENVVMALLHHWYPYHGLPKTLITDRGTGFISHANKMIYKCLGISKIFTSAYHPQTNAKAERVVQEVKKALAMCNITLDESFTDTDDDDPSAVDETVKQIMLLLPSIQFSINQMVHTATQVSPHMLIYGRNLRDIVDFKLARDMLQQLPNDYDNLTKFEIVQQIKSMIKQATLRRNENHEKYVIVMKENYDYSKVPDDFQEGDKVAYYVGDLPRTNKKLHPRFIGPCEIIERLEDRHNVVTIKILGTNKTLSCHTGMLKHYYEAGFTPLIEIKRTNKARLTANKKANKQHKSSDQSDSVNAPNVQNTEDQVLSKNKKKRKRYNLRKRINLINGLVNDFE